ncbi:MAG: GntR family transcriptional regulator [Clostridiales bacterium]|nr:GntR family transcriptional regulator [Clostridiales bacterium]
MREKNLIADASLAEEVADILRDRIINGEYVMGAKLIENKVAKELRVSRTPVRDAFRQLAKEQLVEYVPNKGCFAKGFSRKDMSDIYAVRKAVEQLAATWAVENADDNKIKALGEHLELMGFYTQQNLYDKLLQANEDFHNMIYHMTGSRFLVQILRSYQDYVHVARKNTLKKEEDLSEIYKEHEGIFNAIKSRDIDAAVKRVGDHLDASNRRSEERWIEKTLDR